MAVILEIGKTYNIVTISEDVLQRDYKEVTVLIPLETYTTASKREDVGAIHNNIMAETGQAMPDARGLKYVLLETAGGFEITLAVDWIRTATLVTTLNRNNIKATLVIYNTTAQKIDVFKQILSDIGVINYTITEE